MSKEKRRVPRLRFPGFTGDWEQRKLGDISTKVTTKNVDVHYTETLTNSAEQGIISQVDFFDKEISNKDNINGYYIVENNDFIYNPRISTLAPVGPINRNKLNRTGIMSPLYTVFRAYKVDLGFLEWYFQSNHWHRYMKLNGDSGARADRIAIKDSTFFEMPIKTPVNIKEQVLIGETLEKFNQYITLHQRKLNHLILKKKSLLQKLFPKNGDRYPELRFPGFTDAWEQRKLGDTHTFFTDGNYSNDYPTANEMSDSINGVPFLRGSNLDNGAINLMDVHYITKQKHNLLTSGHTKFDDIIIAVRGSLGNCGYVAKQFIDININSQLAIIRTDKNELSGLFLIEYLLSYLGKKEINRNITGTALKQLPINSLKMINVKYPSINEQEKISILLSKLNTSITLHQRKLDHLQLQKKALLQQLFV